MIFFKCLITIFELFLQLSGTLKIKRTKVYSKLNIRRNTHLTYQVTFKDIYAPIVGKNNKTNVLKVFPYALLMSL